MKNNLKQLIEQIQKLRELLEQKSGELKDEAEMLDQIVEDLEQAEVKLESALINLSDLDC